MNKILYLGVMMAQVAAGLTLTSLDFVNKEYIPHEFSCDGANKSPKLVWSGAPKNTKSYALIVDDPDAPSGTWVHWVIFNIPANKTSLTSAGGRNKNLLDGSMQGVNSSNNIGYDGPCPPPGKPHHYHFKLYALDTLLKLEPGVSKQDLVAATKGHILAQAELVGLYKR
jgi:Raf kinase inhibitor-like YbhB/YbcL family protein